MRTLGRKFTLAVVFVVAMISTSAKGDESGQAKPPQVHEWSWATEAWTGDNKPYLKIRLSIDKAIMQGEKPAALAQRYKALAAKNPIDAQAQFRWAYAARKAALAYRPFERSKLDGILEAMDRTEKPHAYDYTRLRFLIGSYQFTWPQFKNMKIAGERLLKRNPQDADLKYQFIYILGCSPTLQDRKRAISLAQEMVQANPQNADYHGNLAGSYVHLWNLSKHQLGANEAIAEYRQYLLIASPNDAFRPQAERMIKLLQQYRK